MEIPSFLSCMGRISHTNLKNRTVISRIATSKNHIELLVPGQIRDRSTDSWYLSTGIFSLALVTTGAALDSMYGCYNSKLRSGLLNSSTEKYYGTPLSNKVEMDQDPQI
jgi:hypothetical protein